MAVASYWVRAELRRRWRAWLSVALLVGLGGGLVITSLAGARRTDSAYPRFLEWADPPDVVVDPDFEGAGSRPFLDALLRLPGVVHRSDAQAVALGMVERGRVDVGGVGNAMASVGGDRYYERDRVLVTSGRLPDPQEPGEILVTESISDEEGIEVGDRVDFSVLDVEEMFGLLAAGADPLIPAAEAGEPLELTVTGIGVFPELAVIDDEDPQERILVTPALHGTLPDSAHLWDRTGLYLADDADLASLRSRIQELAADMGGATLFEDRGDITARAQRAVRPYVLALAGIGMAMAVFVALLSWQLVRRLASEAEADRDVLRALAASEGTVRKAAGLLAVITATGAALVALVVAAALSTLMPIGPVRDIELAPGVALDWLVIAPVLVGLLAVVVAPAVLAARPSTSAGAMSSGWATSQLRQLGAPLPMVLGVDRATGNGGRERRGVARSGLASVALAVGMLVAVVSFSASLRHLLDHPDLHGWNADVALLGADGYGTFDVRAAAEVEGIEALSASLFGSFTVEGTDVAGLGVLPLRGSLLPPIVDGRQPEPGELLLGADTLERIGGVVGEAVDVRLPGDDETQPMVVAGTALFSGVGQFDNDRPTLGEGALFVLPDEMSEEIEFGWAALFADLSPGADRDEVVANLVEAADEMAGDTQVLEVVRPADVAALDRLGFVPPLLAGLFAIVALGSLVHVLVLSARSWRFDRAVLAALGAGRRELRAAVRWQAVTVVVLGTTVAVPVGIALGRWAWRTLAEDIGVVPDPVVPLGLLAVLLAGLLATALAAATLPNRRAARAQPARHLRSE